MKNIPLSALCLGLAGVMPFGAPLFASVLFQGPDFDLLWISMQLLYGLTILSFMSGCLWGFAAKSDDPVGYGLSTLPALYGFSIIGMIWFGVITSKEALFFIALGFLMLLFLDRRAARLGQAPHWWMALRLLLTGLVCLCLIGGMLR